MVQNAFVACYFFLYECLELRALFVLEPYDRLLLLNLLFERFRFLAVPSVLLHVLHHKVLHSFLKFFNPLLDSNIFLMDVNEVYVLSWNRMVASVIS